MKLFFRQLYLELYKMFARKRTYIGFGGFFAVELLILALLQLPQSKRAFSHLIESNGYALQEYYSGLTLAFLMMTNTIFFLGSLYLALVSGDVIAKEAEDGTLRMVLSRPISRIRLLAIKILSCAVYTAALMFFVVGTSLAAGIAYQGLGKLFVYAPLEGVFGLFGPQQALLRFAYAAMLLSYCTFTISALGFMFSCFNMKPAAATILTLSLCFIDFVVRLIPYFSHIKEYMVTYHMGSWVHVFDPYIPWWQIGNSLVYLSALNASLLLIGGLRFYTRDFKS